MKHVGMSYFKIVWSIFANPQIYIYIYIDVMIISYYAPQIWLLENLYCGSKLPSWMRDSIITNQYTVWKLKQYDGRRLSFAWEIFFFFF
jgi:hypothetical protein